MATLLQYRAAALIARLQAAGTGGNRLARTITRIGTPICPGDGPDAHHALRLKPDHPMGSGHHTDQIQDRLRQEFLKVHNAEYEGGRRGGASDTIKRSKYALPSYTSG